MARQAMLEERAPVNVEPWAWVLYERGGLWHQRKVLGRLSHRAGSPARDPLDVVIAVPDHDVYEEYYDLRDGSPLAVRISRLESVRVMPTGLIETLRMPNLWA